MVQIVWIGAGRLRLFFLVRVGGTDMSNTRGALYSKPRQEIYVKTGTLGVGFRWSRLADLCRLRGSEENRRFEVRQIG